MYFLDNYKNFSSFNIQPIIWENDKIDLKIDLSNISNLPNISNNNNKIEEQVKPINYEEESQYIYV